MLLQEKEHRLESILARFERVAVAFSGGADSSLLLHKALDVLGVENVLILTARSCLLKQSEKDKATTWLARHGYGEGVSQVFVDLQPLWWEEFVHNPQNRCYLCKTKVYTIFKDHCAQVGIEDLIDGTNFDDLHSDRPGLKALKELEISTPLADAELKKDEVRLISRELGLDTWDHPSASCLATRIPTGLAITQKRMERIDKMESCLESLGFLGCRVRLDPVHEEKVFIQVLEKDIAQLAAEEIRGSITHLLNDSGVKKIFLDLQGR